MGKQELTERQKALVEYIQSLDGQKRHVIKLVCRGPEPWEIEEHISKTKIELTPKG
jgi:hypothetical protein